MPHDIDDAAKQDSSVGSRADRFAASHHERRSCYVSGAGMSAEAKALLGQVVFARRRRVVLVIFLLDQPVRFPVRRLTAGLVRSFEQVDHDQGLAGRRRPASEWDAAGLTMDRRLGSLAW